MTDQNNAHINQTTFFNIDVYNNNSTGGDISSIYQTSLQSPLLIHPNEHEICCCRARIPLDQIPLSQDNIPFQQWKIEVGVPIVGALSTYNYYQSYVPQFNPITTSSNIFSQATLNEGLNTYSLPITEPIGADQIVAGTPSLTPIAPAFIGGVKGISNIVFSLSYTVYTPGLAIVQRYTDGASTIHDSINLRVLYNEPNLLIRGMCANTENDRVYVFCYTPDGGGQHFIFDIYTNISFDLGMADPPVQCKSMSCSASQLTLTFSNQISPNVQTDIHNYAISIGAIIPTTTYPQRQMEYSFIDASDNFYVTSQQVTGGVSQFVSKADMAVTPYTILQIYTLPLNSQGAQLSVDNFSGTTTDPYGNLLIPCWTGIDGIGAAPFILLAIDKLAGTFPYTIDNGTVRTLGISQMDLSVVSTNNPAPYAVNTIQDYLDQINLAFSSIMVQIPLPLSSPNLIPTLAFDSSTSIVSIVCDSSCATSLPTSCVINFNKLLWSFFKFRSINAVSTNLGVGSQTLHINNAVAPILSITKQPNSTLYRFADLTRILIGTSRISVKGDNQSSNELLVNFSDFVVDTSNGIPNLIIYQPTILRWYQLYQTSPLNNLDVFVSYANRAGQVFPINISPYNSIGIKLQFRNSNSLANQYSDSRT